MSRSPSAHGVLSIIFAVLLIPQFFLAGAMTFSGLADGTDAHNGLGLLLAVLSLVILIVALVTRTAVPLSVALVVLMVVQVVLAGLGREGSPWLGALHAVNALAIFGVAGALAHRGGAPGMGTRRRRAAA